MIEDLRRKLHEAAARLERARQVDAMLESLRREVRALGEREFELRMALGREEADVERLERTSAASLIAALLGNRDEKLDKERREAAAAKLKYDAALRQLEDCRERIGSLSAEREALRDSRARYDGAFGKMQALLRGDPARSARLCGLEARLGEAKSRLREIDEAIFAGEAAMSQIEDIRRHLGSAEGWGTWDLLGGGLLSDMAKHSHLDEAQAGAEHLQILLSRFRTELADVQVAQSLGAVNIDGFLRFADYFFDGLIADWTVQSRIHDSQYSVSQVKSEVSGALSRLQNLRGACESEAASLEAQIAEIILRA